MREKLNKILHSMTVFQWCEIIAIIGFTVYFGIIDKENPLWYILISSAAAICGVFCVVLCAAGKKSQYYWGFVNIIAYVVTAWVNSLYGEVMLNALYYLPTQFIGIYYWNRHYSKEENHVESRKMSLPVTLILVGACALCIWLYKMLLTYLGGNVVWLDSASTVISVIANILMVMRYREQWLLWIIVDAVTVAMWVVSGDLIMTAMWVIYFINACYGFYMWSKPLAKKS